MEVVPDFGQRSRRQRWSATRPLRPARGVLVAAVRCGGKGDADQLGGAGVERGGLSVEGKGLGGLQGSD